MRSCLRSGTQGPALQLGPKNLAEAAMRSSVKVSSGLQDLATNADSKYCKNYVVIYKVEVDFVNRLIVSFLTLANTSVQWLSKP